MDKLFSNSSLLIPAQLHEIVVREGFRPERQTAIYLIYNVIAQKCSSMKRKWTRISDLAFKSVVKNHTRKSGVKRWLEENGFITIEKWTTKDGTIKNSKIPGRRCQAYGVIEQGNESIWVELWKRKLDWPISTWSDPFCAYTREVLGKIKVDCAQVERILGGEADFSNLTSTRRLSVVHWARTLHYGSGSIRRGRRVNRLYSPWTSCPRELRKACLLSGEPIVSIDLQASQPTLIGLLAKDADFSTACFNDTFYGEIGRLFAVDRDEAKRICLSYIYGANRKPTARNKQAFQVQEYVAEHFPTTHSFVWGSKLHDHTIFSCQLQNQEAKLFLCGIMAKMMQEKIPALTVHDSISVPASFEKRAVEITKTILGQTLRGRARVKISHHGEGSDKVISI